MKKILILFLGFFILLPISSVMAYEVTPINDREFKVTGLRVTIPEGQSGTYTIGGGKFMPAEAGGNYLSDVVIKTNRGISPQSYINVTYGNGFTESFENGGALSVNLLNSLFANPSKGITVNFTSDGSKERWAEISYFSTLESISGGGNGNDGGGGSDPGNGGSVAKVPANHYYVPYRDEYRADYTAPSGTAKYQLYFKTANGTVYTLDYTSRPTGIHYLTCNGTYTLNFFDSSGALIGKTDEMITTSIANPACKSYTEDEANGRNGLNARVDGNQITWDKPSGADKIEIWKDGQKLGEVNGDSTEYPTSGDGSYSIVAKDPSGNILDQSDLNINSSGTDPGGGDPPTNGGGCDDVCQKYRDALECPEFDEYLGKWTDGISSTYPKLAQDITNALVPAMGDEIVKRAPEVAKIIADEFQSREKPVAPPPNIPSFNPEDQLPKLEDTPEVKGDLTTGVPNFNPDYSEDSGFSIPDPMDLDFTDNSDGGYGYPNKTDNSSPDYKKVEKEEESPKYIPTLKWDENLKQYKPIYVEQQPDRDYTITGNDQVNPPSYKPKGSDSKPAPNYEVKDGGAAAPDYSHDDIGIKNYEGK